MRHRTWSAIVLAAALCLSVTAADAGPQVEMPAPDQPGSANWYLARGDVLLRAGKVEEGLAEYGEAIRVEPAYSYSYFRRAGVYLGRLKRDDLALADLNESLRLFPGNAEGLELRGEIYLRAAKPDLALADFEAALKAYPQFAEGFVGRSQAKKALGDFKGAVADANAAIKLSPQYPAAYLARAQAKAALGDTAGSAADLTRYQALSAPPTRPAP